MQNQILQQLQITPKEYEALVLEKYLKWCTERTETEQSLQKILTCQPLYNWWKAELSKLELQFIQDIETYRIEVTAKEAMVVYHLITAKIKNRFSKPLLKKANDAKTINQ